MAGGGIKINNISVSGGADGKTPVFKIENGKLFNSYDNGITWYELGQVKGADGSNGVDGKNGAKLVSQILQGQDEQGGNIYKQTFDDGTIAFFVAPKGERGEKGESFNGVTVDTPQVVTGQKYFTKPVVIKSEVDESVSSETFYGVNNITRVDVDDTGEEYNYRFPNASGEFALRENIEDTYATKTEVSKNTQNIKMLKNALLQAEIIASAEIDEAFTTRTTAGGLKIVDEQKTQVLEIKGSTVRCENLFDKSDITLSASDFANCSDYSLSEDKNVIIATGNTSESTMNNAYSHGWVRPTYYATRINDKGISFKTGEKITISADITLIEQGDKEARIAFQWGAKDNVGTIQSGGNKDISTTKQRYTHTLTMTADGTNGYPIICINSNRVKIENVMISKNGVTEYQPYFTDLKHSYFKGVKSTNNSRNLFDISAIEPYITRDSEDENYFTFNEVPQTHCYEVMKFDEPKNIYLKYKYKAYDKSAADTDIGVCIMLQQSDNQWKAKATYLNRDGYEEFYYEGIKAIGFSRFDANDVYQNTIGEIMISTVDIPFEPYVKDTYELPQTLELMKWDKFNPQTGEITRATKRIVFTGNESWTTGSTSKNDVYRNMYVVPTDLSTNASSTVAHGISNQYQTISGEKTYYGQTGVSVTSSKTNTTCSVCDPDYCTSDISMWKAHLAELYAAGTPLIVEYELATPTVETVENAPISYTAYNQGTETVVQGETDNSVYGALPSVKNDYLVIVGGEEDEI
jgi:hypothetical protein